MCGARRTAEAEWPSEPTSNGASPEDRGGVLFPHIYLSEMLHFVSDVSTYHVAPWQGLLVYHTVALSGQQCCLALRFLGEHQFARVA